MSNMALYLYAYGLGLESLAIATLIGDFSLAVAVFDAELDVAFCGCAVRKHRNQPLYHVVHGLETDVGHFTENLAREIDPCIDHHILGDAEHAVACFIETFGLTLLALLVAEEDEVDYFGVDLPRRSKVQIHAASRHIEAVAVIHAESHFGKIGVAIVLCNVGPDMAEGVEAVVVLFLHAHVGTYLMDAVAHVGIKLSEVVWRMWKLNRYSSSGPARYLSKVAWMYG